MQISFSPKGGFVLIDKPVRLFSDVHFASHTCVLFNGCLSKLLGLVSLSLNLLLFPIELNRWNVLDIINPIRIFLYTLIAKVVGSLSFFMCINTCLYADIVKMFTVKNFAYLT